jgi:hypothetical protein
MTYPMKKLQISNAMQKQIDHMWASLTEENWLEIEDKASAKLKRALESKVDVLRRPLLVERLPEYLGFEQRQIDRAVLRTAVDVLGRPAYKEMSDDEAEFPESGRAKFPEGIPLRLLALAHLERRNQGLDDSSSSEGEALHHEVERTTSRPSSSLLPGRPRAL